MSASMRPTRAPDRASATARLTATVDLPTPPLPLDTAITWPRCGYDTRASGRSVAPAQAVSCPSPATAGAGGWNIGHVSLTMICPANWRPRRDLSACAAGELRAAALAAHDVDLGNAQPEVRLDPLHQRRGRHVAVRTAARRDGASPRRSADRMQQLDRFRLGHVKQRPQPRNGLANPVLDRHLLGGTHDTKARRRERAVARGLRADVRHAPRASTCVRTPSSDPATSAPAAFACPPPPNCRANWLTSTRPCCGTTPSPCRGRGRGRRSPAASPRSSAGARRCHRGPRT